MSVLYFFFFKQKTAYEMRISDWSSDVCSSDLRTWLDRQRPAKAQLADPRRAPGHLLGNGVRFGRATDVLAAGEGIETLLALKSVLPDLPMIAARSANHPAALALAAMLARLSVPPAPQAAARAGGEAPHHQ